MLTSTFLHAPGIGHTTERRLWDSGIREWQDFLAADCLPIPAARRRAATVVIEQSLERLEARDHRWFAAVLPRSEHWRAAGEFADQMAFLDIETTGTGLDAHPTVVGLYDFARGEMRQFIYDEALREFADVVDEYGLLVTFFGTGFDLPVLSHWDPRIRFHQLHVDLCPLFHRLGYKGGLKRIERQLGLRRSDEVDGLTGWDAVQLWWRWRQGDHKALHTLLEYNRADVVNMVELLGIATRLARAASGFDTPAPRVTLLR
jgi:uncharacterized protein YprB with RNaseH-like and TPR domain